jgi:hypothetical protein
VRLVQAVAAWVLAIIACTPFNARAGDNWGNYALTIIGLVWLSSMLIPVICVAIIIHAVLLWKRHGASGLLVAVLVLFVFGEVVWVFFGLPSLGGWTSDWAWVAVPALYVGLIPVMGFWRTIVATRRT